MYVKSLVDLCFSQSLTEIFSIIPVAIQNIDKSVKTLQQMAVSGGNSGYVPGRSETGFLKIPVRRPSNEKCIQMMSRKRAINDPKRSGTR
jgi:hypothetical protein